MSRWDCRSSAPRPITARRSTLPAPARPIRAARGTAIRRLSAPMAPSAPPLPPLREVIERHQLAARKTLGQNFLLDLNLTLRIARAAAPLEHAEIIEIGPGPG